MAKQLTITDPSSGVTYTLEYTRKTVEMMERQGFIAADVEKKPMTLRWRTQTLNAEHLHCQIFSKK